MKFSLIICGYNEEDNLDRCLSSCLSLDYPKNDYEIIYVDNNSRDRSLEIAKKYPIKTYNESKQGLSEARNTGIKKSTGEILVFLDADLELDRDYLKYQGETFLDKNIGAGGGKVLPLVRTWVADYLGVSLFEGYPRYKHIKYIKTYPGCNLTIKKEILEKIGVFQENLKSAAGVTRFAEDKEICARIRKAGFKILYNPNAVVFHLNISTFKGIIRIWIKGSEARLSMIKSGSKDLFSLFFKYNLPLIYIGLIFLFIFINDKVSISLILLGILFICGICLKASIETGMIFQSIFVKPWMDILSILIINISTIIYRIK